MPSIRRPTDVLTKIVHRHPSSHIDELLPWAYAITAIETRCVRETLTGLELCCEAQTLERVAVWVRNIKPLLSVSLQFVPQAADRKTEHPSRMGSVIIAKCKRLENVNSLNFGHVRYPALHRTSISNIANQYNRTLWAVVLSSIVCYSDEPKESELIQNQKFKY